MGSMTNSSISIGIIGGGLAGTLLMNALTRHANLDVHLYEARSELQERGASIGLSVNAQRALGLLGLENVTKRANAVKVGCLKLIVGEGADEGELIYDVDFGKETVHRAALLRELLVPIEKERLHFNKNLAKINENSVTFTDGTNVRADVIIGADGIHSTVRKFILGPDNPQVAPVPSGFWDARSIVSYDKAVEKLGSLCIDKTDPHQHIHIGGKGIILHDFIDDSNKICIVASGPVPKNWDVSKWTHRVTRGWLDKVYDGWGQYGRNALDLLFGDKDEIPAFLQWESAKASKLYNGHICMIGDAAHACSPWQGSGLSQAIEDTLILERLLERCQAVEEIPSVLEIFDRIRRPHAQQVIESSRGAAEAYFKAWSGGVEKLRQEIPSREYILEWDTAGAVRDAVESLERAKQIRRKGHVE